MNPWLVLPVSIAVSVPVNTLVNIPAVAFSMGFQDLVWRLACIRMGCKGYHFKTRTNSMQVMPPRFQTHADTRICLLVLL